MDTTSIEEDISTFSQYLMYTERALEQKGTFANAVVEKVVVDFQEKMLILSREVQPKLASVREATEKILAELHGLEEKSRKTEDLLQEFQLRRAIGAIDEETYKTEASDVEQDLNDQTQEVNKFQKDYDRLMVILKDWDELSVRAQQNEHLNYVEPQGLIEQAPQEEPIEGPAIVEAEIIDDVKLFAEPPLPPPVEKVEEVVAPVVVEETPSIPPVLEESLDQVFEEAPFSDDLNDLGDALGERLEPVQENDGVSQEESLASADEQISSDANLEGSQHETLIEEGDFFLPEPSVPEDHIRDNLSLDMGLDINLETDLSQVDFELDASDRSNEDVVERAAMLVYNEGAADEKLIPLSEDVFTIGRSVGNNYKIKNDSKVSRKHCQIFRKGNVYYIEDLNSSNGTYVGGELISERPLYGGEQLKVGECVFTFRLQ